MNLQSLFSKAANTPVRIGLVGAGDFGMTMIAQARRFPLLSLKAVCDLNVERAYDDMVSNGFIALT